MADALKVLGQLYPAAGVLTTLYTVPAATQATVSTFKACNQGPADDAIRVSIAVSGATDEAKQYAYYDLPLAAKDTFSATEGWTLSATDVVRVQSRNGTTSFTLFGLEIS